AATAAATPTRAYMATSGGLPASAPRASSPEQAASDSWVTRRMWRRSIRSLIGPAPSDAPIKHTACTRPTPPTASGDPVSVNTWKGTATTVIWRPTWDTSCPVTRRRNGTDSRSAPVSTASRRRRLRAVIGCTLSCRFMPSAPIALRDAEAALLDHREYIGRDLAARLVALEAEHLPELLSLAHRGRLAWMGPAVGVESIY